MYKLINDVDEVKKFFDEVMPPLNNSEVYFISLSARNKYLTEEERRELALGRTEMFERRVIRERSFERFLRTLRKFETNEGSYLTKNGSNIPNKSIIVYFNINPTDVLKTHKEFNQTMNEYMYELAHCAAEGRKTDDIMKRICKQDTLLMNCFQKNKGTKHYIDIDFDVPKDYYNSVVAPFIERIRSKEGKVVIIDTRGGYHILLKKNSIKFNFNDDIYKANEDFALEYMKRHEVKLGANVHIDIKKETGYEIISNKNAMIPVPGTFQGGYPVTILDV
jgi:hypothetical protein